MLPTKYTLWQSSLFFKSWLTKIFYGPPCMYSTTMCLLLRLAAVPGAAILPALPWAQRLKSRGSTQKPKLEFWDWNSTKYQRTKRSNNRNSNCVKHIIETCISFLFIYIYVQPFLPFLMSFATSMVMTRHPMSRWDIILRHFFKGCLIILNTVKAKVGKCQNFHAKSPHLDKLVSSKLNFWPTEIVRTFLEMQS